MKDAILADGWRFGAVLAVLFVAVTAITSMPASAQASDLWGDLKPGPHKVGFQVIYRFDYSRPYYADTGGNSETGAGNTGRPIRIFVWYPAKDQGLGDPMTFGDYLSVSPRSSHFAQWNQRLERRDRDTAVRQFAYSNPDSLLEILSSTPTAAYREAVPEEGSYAIVLYSQGRNDYQMENTVLAEYLASHGYIVANVPQLGRDPLHTKLSFTLPDLTLQVEDLRFLLTELRRLPNADLERVAAIGHSSGGLVALMLAGLDRRVDAVVGLDGSFVTPDGAELYFDWQNFDPGRIRIPILNLYGSSSPERLSFSLLDTLEYSTQIHAGWEKATHFDFQNWPLYSRLVGIDDPRGASWRETEVGAEIHLAVIRSTERFLNAVFYGTSEEFPRLAKTWTEPEPAETDPTVRFQEGREVPYPEDVAALLVTGQTGQALDLIQNVRERYPTETVFRFGDLSQVADEIASLGRESEVPTIYNLQAELWPQSLIAQYQAGEALYKAGRGEEAVPRYQAILGLTEDQDLEPGSQPARIRSLALERLSELDPESLESGDEESF